MHNDKIIEQSTISVNYIIVHPRTLYLKIQGVCVMREHLINLIKIFNLIAIPDISGDVALTLADLNTSVTFKLITKYAIRE